MAQPARRDRVGRREVPLDLCVELVAGRSEVCRINQHLAVRVPECRVSVLERVAPGRECTLGPCNANSPRSTAGFGSRRRPSGRADTNLGGAAAPGLQPVMLLNALAPVERGDEVWRWFAEDVVIEPPQVVQRGGQQALRCAGVVPGAHVDDHLGLDTGITQHLPERIAG